MLLVSQSIPQVDSSTLYRIYKEVTKPIPIKHAPIRKHYNLHSFG